MSELSRIESELKKRVVYDPDYKAFRKKTTRLNVLGLRLLVIRQVTDQTKLFESKTQKKIIKSLDEIWNKAKFHETKTVVLLHLRNKISKLTIQEWKVIKSWIDQIENWEHSDLLSSLYSVLFEKYPKEILPVLKKWNKSKNPWKQRASIVSLIYYASPKRKAPPVSLIFEMVEPLIASKDKYVNKAVGWTLRESYKIYPDQTFAFIKKHICNLSPESFSYSTEKVTKEQKVELKKLRSAVSSRA